MGKKEKKTRKKGKRVRKGRKHEGVKVWKKYVVKGESVERTNSHCPRCGPGTLLSKHKGSNYCGKCGYTDFKTGKQEAKKEEPEKSKEPEKAEEKKE